MKYKIISKENLFQFILNYYASEFILGKIDFDTCFTKIKEEYFEKEISRQIKIYEYINKNK